MVPEKNHLALLLCGGERAFQVAGVAAVAVGEFRHQIVVTQNALAAGIVLQGNQCPSFTAITAQAAGVQQDKTAAVRFQRVIPIKVGIVGNRQWRSKTPNGAVLRMEGRRKAQRHGADSAGKKVMTLPRVDGFVAPASGGE